MRKQINYSYLNRKETETDDKVCNPVDSDGNSCCHRASCWIEEFSNEEPWDGTGSGSKHNNVEDDQNNAKVWEPRCHVLCKKFEMIKIKLDRRLLQFRDTLRQRQMVRRITSTHIPAKPISWRVLRPAFSIKMRETMVISTFMPPIPSVAYWEVSEVNPAERKMSVE